MNSNSSRRVALYDGWCRLDVRTEDGVSWTIFDHEGTLVRRLNEYESGLVSDLLKLGFGKIDE